VNATGRGKLTCVAPRGHVQGTAAIMHPRAARTPCPHAAEPLSAKPGTQQAREEAPHEPEKPVTLSPAQRPWQGRAGTHTPLRTAPRSIRARGTPGTSHTSSLACAHTAPLGAAPMPHPASNPACMEAGSQTRSRASPAGKQPRPRTRPGGQLTGPAGGARAGSAARSPGGTRPRSAATAPPRPPRAPCARGTPGSPPTGTCAPPRTTPP